MPLEQIRMKPPQDMTPEELRIAVAEIVGNDRLFYLMKRGYYYRHDAKGYTSLKSAAWVVTKEIAEKYVYSYDEPVTMHPVDAPAYSTSLDAMAEAEGTLNHNDIGEYLDNLEKVCVPVHICPTTHAFSLIHATANERAIAFVQTMRKDK